MLNWIVWSRTYNLHKMDLALNNLQRLICHNLQLINLNRWITKRGPRHDKGNTRVTNKTFMYFIIPHWLFFQRWKTTANISLGIFCVKQKMFANKVIYPIPPPRGVCDTRSVFKRSGESLNSDFPSLRLVASPNLKNPVSPDIYP